MRRRLTASGGGEEQLQWGGIYVKYVSDSNNLTNVDPSTITAQRIGDIPSSTTMDLYIPEDQMVFDQTGAKRIQIYIAKGTGSNTSDCRPQIYFSDGYTQSWQYTNSVSANGKLVLSYGDYRQHGNIVRMDIRWAYSYLNPIIVLFKVTV